MLQWKRKPVRVLGRVLRKAKLSRSNGGLVEFSCLKNIGSNPIEEKRCIKEIITRAGLKDLLRSDYSPAEACRGKHEVLLNSDSSRTSLKMDFGQVY